MNATKRHRWIWIAGDYIASAVALFAFALVRYYTDIHSGFPSLESFLVHPPVMLEQVLFPLFVVGLSALGGCYQNLLHKSYLQEAANAFTVAIMSTGVFFLVALIDDTHDDRVISYRLILSLVGLLMCALYIERCFLTAYTRRMISSGKWFYPAILIGSRNKITDLRKSISQRQGDMALKPVGCVVLDSSSADDSTQLPQMSIDQAISMAADNSIEKFIITENLDSSASDMDLINRLLITGKDILVPPSSLSPLTLRGKITNVTGIPLVNIGFTSVSPATLNIKRCLDITGASLGLLLSLPVLAVGAIAVATDSKGPIIYRQMRVGRYGKQFPIIKLRTMHDNAEPQGPSLSFADDPRITRTGHWLRKYRIDELPQFVNILRGDMSLVGPRPERSFFLDQLREELPEYTLLQRVRPGLTSWGMVKFGYASSIEEIKQRARIDLLYLDNMTLLTDIKIILYTIRTVITGKGI